MIPCAPFAVGSYVLNGVAVLINTYLLTTAIPRPLSYVVYVTATSMIFLAAAPLRHMPSLAVFAIGSLSALTWTAGAYFLYAALNIGLASRISRVIDTIQPVLFLAYSFLLQHDITCRQACGAAICVLGLVLIKAPPWCASAAASDRAHPHPAPGRVAPRLAGSATFLPFYERLLHEVEQDPASAWMYYQRSLLCLLLHRNPRDDAVWDHFLQAVNACAGHYSRIGRVPGYAQNRSNVSPEAVYFANYAAYQHLQTGDSKTNWVLDRLKRALRRDGRLFFEQLLGTELPMAGIEMRQPQAALDILPCCYQQGNATADALSERLLSRMRIYFPDEVDDALKAMQVPQDARLRIRVNQPNERVDNLLGAQTTNFDRDQMLLGPAAQRAAPSRVFAAAAECKNIQERVEGLLRQAINLGYDAEVLPAR